MMTCGKAGRREQSGSSGPAGHFLGTVTKAHDRGEEEPQDLPELPAATGDLLCTSQPALHHHKPKKGQLAQIAKAR